MRRLFFCAMTSLFVIGVSVVASETYASAKLSLASVTNPNALPVGQTVMFQVELSELTVGQELDYLAAVINYNSTLRGKPTTVKGGAIPNPLSRPLDFVISEGGGRADASFSTTSTTPAHHIQTNGTFYTFSTKVLKAGSSTLSFGYVDASEFNSANPDDPHFFTPALGPDLNVTGVVTPEPSTWVLLVTAALSAVAYYLKRRR
jgi:hypothetical protein